MEIIITLFLGLVCGLLALACYLYGWHKKLRTNLAQLKFVPADPSTVKEGTLVHFEEEVEIIQESGHDKTVFTVIEDKPYAFISRADSLLRSSSFREITKQGDIASKFLPVIWDIHIGC